jgi:hypothetical protein
MKKLGKKNRMMIPFAFLLIFLCHTYSSYGQIICQDHSVSSNVHIEIPLKDVSYYSYNLNTEDSANFIRTVFLDHTIESFIAQLHGNEIAEGVKIELIRKIVFSQNYETFSVVKYRVLTKEGTLSAKGLVQAKLMANKWISCNLITNESIVYVLDKLKPVAFWNFYSSENDPTFSDINSFKRQVKTNEGTLDIVKLAQLIKEKESFLSKHLD